MTITCTSCGTMAAGGSHCTACGALLPPPSDPHADITVVHSPSATSILGATAVGPHSDSSTFASGPPGTPTSSLHAGQGAATPASSSQMRSPFGVPTPVPPPFGSPAGGPGFGAAPSSAKSSSRWWLIGAAVVAVLAVAGGLAIWGISSSRGHDTATGNDLRTESLAADRSSTTSASPAATASASTPDAPMVNGVPATGSATTVAAIGGGVSTTDLAAPTNEQRTFSLDDNKCGSDPAKVGAYRPDGTYEITATVKLWPTPDTGGSPIARLDVDSYGPGGIGCPDGKGVFVQVLCKTQGQSVTGPFGADRWWERVSINGLEGYVSDEWLDSKWDSDGFALC